MLAGEDISAGVTRVLIEALNVDEDEVRPAATLQGDLGAESIAFLDIVFRLEREFGITNPRGELFPDSIFQGDPDLVRDGRVTDQGMVELRSRMPYANLSGFDRDRRVDAVPELFTVALLNRYIAWKLGPGSGARPDSVPMVPTPPVQSPSQTA
jgi:acyl carrier protein